MTSFVFGRAVFLAAAVAAVVLSSSSGIQVSAFGVPPGPGITKLKRLGNKRSTLQLQSRTSFTNYEAAQHADQNNMVGVGRRGLDFGCWGQNKNKAGLKLNMATTATMGDAYESASSSSSATAVPVSHVVMVVDENKSKEDAKVAKALSDMLTKSADSGNSPTVSVNVVTPTTLSKVATGGGGDHAVVVLFSSSFADREDLEWTLEKVPVLSTPSTSTTHVVLVSTLGTTRTDKVPYSMQNLMGRKLSKKQSMEESLIGRCRQGLGGGQIPLEYTVVKWGAIKPDGSIAKGKSNDSNNSDYSVNVNLQYGDSLDGDIEVSDAAQVLYQSIALQKYAHNSIFSAVTKPSGSASTPSLSQLQQPHWDDLFLRLDGPELQRFDIGTSMSTKADDAEALKMKKKYALLCEYVLGWADQFDAKSKSAKNMGLSTPVTVSKKSSSPNSVQIKFKSTNTGSSYRSAKDDKTMETNKRRSVSPGSESSKTPVPAPPSNRVVGMAKKEGGVEVLVDVSPDTYGLRVRAKRCNLEQDGSTIIKEMSEETILNTLQSALKYWQKEVGVDADQ